jgi:hypothetical protein
MKKPATDIDLQQEEEQILIAAVRKAMATVKKSATVQNLKNLDATKKALADFQANKAARTNPEDRSFKNIPAVHVYLTEERGYKVSERKVYDDKRLIIKQSDGCYLLRDVEEYASRFLPKRDGSDDNEGELTKRKLQKEIELQDEKIDRERRRNKVETGKLILRSKVDQQLAARAAFLISDLESFAHGKLPEIAERAIDSTNATDEVIAYLAELRAKIGPELSAVFLSEMRKWLDRYAQPLQFQAPIASELDLDDDYEETED